MTEPGAREGREDGPIVPRWALVGGLVLLALTAGAAPFYGAVMGGLLWAGETLKALCGW